MKKFLMALLLAAAIGACLMLDYYASSLPPLTDAATYLKAAELNPPRPLPQVEGLPAIRPDQITLVHTWASWCPPCVAEIPQLIRETHWKSPQITIIALGADATPEAFESAISKAYQNAGVLKDSTIQWVADPSQTVGSALTQSRQMPETLIISGNPPHITHHLKGPAPWPLLIPYLLSKN